MPHTSSVSGRTDEPGRRWPSSRDARALIIGGLRVRGWTWLLSMLWVAAGAVSTGYFFYITTKPWTAADQNLGIVGWAATPVALQIVVALATIAWYAPLIPAPIAGSIRLRGWRRGNWLRAAAWAVAWIAGVALLLQASSWSNTHWTPAPIGLRLHRSALLAALPW